MVIDFHTHIFPDEIRNNREKYFFSEQSFELLYRSSNSKMTGVDEIIESMDKTGVDMSVVFGFPWNSTETYEKHNDYIIDSVSKYPDRLRGFCCFDMFNENASNEVERCIEKGISGVGELAVYRSGIDDEALKKLEPVMGICFKNDLPIMIHTNESLGHNYAGKTPVTLDQIYKLIKSFPENKIVLAHWGGGIFFYNLLKREMKNTLKNTYFDTAASPFLYDSNVYRFAMDIVGREKILFGTDYPLLNPDRYFKEFESIGLEENDLEYICGKNAAVLLKI
ncbi:MAG: amidohydrolase [Desulfobacterales bacterium]|nr:amidohydrolase [Desulfobacteraceae bacterium]MBT7086083.1 amidohydrolase [Desulfobacterales bacterium]MBT7695888.1 amidohydrolase [Desulfobacterales bacterium]